MSVVAAAPGASTGTERTLQRPLPPPNDGQLEEARELCSQLHHAFYARPSVDDKDARLRWYAFYLDTTYRLSVLLGKCAFTDLPRIATASLYRSNLRAKMRSEFVDLEDIHPPGAQYPDVEPPFGLRRLPYNPTDTGQVALKPVAEMKRKWWKGLSFYLLYYTLTNAVTSR